MDKKTTVDDRLLEMESEAAQFINTDRLKALFRWIKSITEDTGNPKTSVVNRMLALRLYFFLWVLHTIHEEIRTKTYGKTNQDRDRVLKLILNFNKFSLLNLDSVHHPKSIDLQISLASDLNRSLDLYLNLDFFLKCASKLDLHIDSLYNGNLYYAFYGCMDPEIYAQATWGLVYCLDHELEYRIGLVESIKAAEIFKRVNWERIVQRYKTQQENIKAVREGKPFDPPEETIHATWCSVLQITDEMLSMSYEEMERCVQYFREVNA